MPYYINLPDGRDVEFPDNYPRAEAMQIARNMIVPTAAQDVVPAPEQPERGWLGTIGARAGDVAGSLTSGAGGVLSGIGGIGGILGAGYDNAFVRAGRGLQETGESFMSQELLAKRAALTEAMKAAEGQGLLAEAAAAFKAIMTDPGLLASMTIEQIPQFVASGGIGRGAMAAGQIASRVGARAATLGAEAAEQAAITAGRRAATAAAIGTGAGLQSGEVANQTYQDVMQLPVETIARSKDYQDLLATMRPEQARQRLAESAAREAGIMAAGISATTMYALPGAEQLMFKQQLSRRAINRVLGGVVGEAGQEAFEEGGGQFAQNVGASRADTERDLTRGVAGAATQGAILGGIVGGGIAGIRGGPPAPAGDTERLPVGLRQAINEYVANREPVAEQLLITGREPTIETPVGELTPTQLAQYMEKRLPDMMAADPELGSRIQYAETLGDPEAVRREKENIFNEALRLSVQQDREARDLNKSKESLSRVEGMGLKLRTEESVRKKVEDFNRQVDILNNGLTAAQDFLFKVQANPNAKPETIKDAQTKVDKIKENIERKKSVIDDLIFSVPAMNAKYAAPEAKAEDARAAFAVARARAERLEQQKQKPGLEVPSGTLAPDTVPAQTEDLRAGAPDITEQRYVLNPQYENGRMVGGEEVVQIGEADNFGNVLAYVRRQREGSDIVETVPVETTMDKLVPQPVRETPRMTQEVSSGFRDVSPGLVSPPRGVDVEGQSFAPRAAIDRTGGPELSARQTEAAPIAQPVQPTEEEARSGRRKAAQDKLNKLYLDKLKEKGRAGRLLRNALVDALKNNTLTADQVYAAFIAAETIAPLMPAKADHRIQFVAKLLADEGADAALAASGGTRGEVQGLRIRPAQPGLMGLIQISLSPTQLGFLRETSAHEAFHVLQDYYRKYDPKFAQFIDGAFKDGMMITDVDASIRRKLQSFRAPNSNRSYWDNLVASLPETLDAREAQAYAFGALVDAKNRGVPMTGLKPSLTRFINSIATFFNKFGNALRGNGYRTFEDVFTSAAENDARRFAEMETPTAADFPTATTEQATQPEALAPLSENVIQLSARKANMSVPEFKTWWEGGWRGKGYTPKQSVARLNGQPIEFYHGTQKNFPRFGKARSGSYGQEGPFYFSPDTGFSNDYAMKALYAGAKETKVTSGQRIIPVYLSIQNPFDSTNPKRQEELLKYVNDGLDDGSLTWKDIAISKDILEIDQSEFERDPKLEAKVVRGAYTVFQNILTNDDPLSEGDNWQALETPAAQKFLREKGFDSFYIMEYGVKNVAVFDPRQIKSVFNKFEEGAATSPEFSARRVAAEPVLLRDINQLVKDAQSQENWRDWYTRHEATINDLFGDDAPLFKKILSATSQAASVPANVALAIKAYKQMLSGDTFTGYLPAVIRNLERIRTDEGLRGQKISQYGQAVTADEAEAAKGVAVDRHIARLLFGVDRPTARQVEVATDIINQIANRLGWEPRQVQAALWAFNQVKEGVDPKNVKSYDTYLARKAEEIRQFRSSFSGAEGRGVRPSQTVAQRIGETQGSNQVEFSARQSPLMTDPMYQQYMDGLTGTAIPRSGIFGGLFRRLVGAMESTALYGTPDTPERFRDALLRTTVNRTHPVWMLQMLAQKQGVLNGRDIGAAVENALTNTGRMQILATVSGLGFDPSTGDITVRDDVPSLMEIFKDKVDSKNQRAFQTYAIALRERDLRAVGRVGMKNLNGRPFTTADINNIIQTAERANPEFVQVAADLKKFSDHLLDFAVASGIMTQAKAQELALLFYTPFYREMENDAKSNPGDVIGPAISSTLRNTSNALDKKLGGGDGKIGDLFENIVRNADSIIRAGLKNYAIRMTADVARDVNLGRVVNKPGKNVVTYRVNGNEVHFQVDDSLLFTAMATAPAKTRGAIHTAMARMASFFRDMITLAPSFMWANLYRGKFQAYAQEGASFSPFTTIKGFQDSLKNGASFKAFTAQTGFGGYTFGMGEKDFSKKFKKILDDRGLYGELARFNLLAPFKKGIEGLQRISEATELAERLAIYEKMKASGMTDKQAAFQAYLLAPFSRQGSGDGFFGSIVQGLIPLVPFLNAKVQSLYRLVENEKGAKTIAKIPQQIFLRSLMITAFSSALYAMALAGGHDDELDNLTVDDIIRYDSLFLGDKKRIALPRNFELGSFFGAIPILAMEAYRKGHADDLTKAVASIGTSTLFFNPIPQAVLPIVSVVTNYDFFRGREIESGATQRLPTEERVDRSTTTIAKLLSRLTTTASEATRVGTTEVLPKISPIDMQFLINGYTGSIGAGITAGFDTALGALGLIPGKPAGALGDPASPTAIAASLLGLSRFYRTEETSVSRFVSDFYKIKELSEQTNNSMREATLVRDFDRVLDLRSERGPLLAMKGIINSTNTQLSDLNKRIRAIEAGDLSPTEKLDRIAPLRERRDTLARNIVDRARSLGAI